MGEWPHLGHMPPAYPKWGVEPFHGHKWNVLVYGFKIGSDKLEPEHKAGIAAYAARLMEKTPSYYFVVVAKGNCSRSGSVGVNLALSVQRAAAVANHLRSLVNSRVTVLPFGHGEAAAEIDGMWDGSESERHRSVLLVASDYKPGTPPPTLPKIKLKIQKITIWKPPPPNGQFSVQMLGGYEGGAGIPLPFGLAVGGSFARFKIRIRDLSRFMEADYYLYTASYKGDWGAPGSLEALTAGPPQNIRVDPDYTVEDFDGFVDVAAGSIDFANSVAGFGNIMGFRDLEAVDRDSVPFQFSIPPGTQSWEFGKFGIGISSGKGYLSIIK